MCVRFVVVCMEILSVGMEGKQKVLDRKGAVLHPGMDGRNFLKNGDQIIKQMRDSR